MNRCDVRALQRKDLERTSKEKPCSLQTVGYGWAEMGDGGQKRVAWDGSKENLAQKKIFLFMEKVTFEDSKERLVQMENFWLVKRLAFEDSKQSFLQMKVFWLEKRAAFECI